ncbi:Relaxin receptor 2 [Trichoplax sp. H2]|nr:Relaxin receptor 2 [Trichoplax sp. H2]|eukprot:RDD37279.1 Relaxin receptor 2 [Trichoplax sp. H2]
MPCAISALLQGSDAILCKIQGFLVTLFNGASLVMATAVSVDRCSAVYNPYNYLSDLRASRYAISIAAVWLVPLPLAIIPLLPFEKYGLGRYTYQNVCWISLSVDSSNYAAIGIFAASITCAILIIVCCYTIIFYIAYRKSNTPLVSFNGIQKSIRTTFLIVGTSMICWLPIATMTVYGLAYYVKYNRKFIIAHKFQIVILLLSYCNVAINPIIYAMTNGIIRRRISSSVYLFCQLICIFPRFQRGLLNYSFLLNKSQTTSRVTPMEITTS